MSWQPIETAPRVHAHMILGPNRYGVVDTLCWNDSINGWDDGLGYDRDDDDPPLPPCEPDVWMPVPALPAKSDATSPASQVGMSFQSRVLPWLMECFGAEIAGDVEERCDRFIEEALEQVQSLGWPKERALALVEYVYGRPAGEPHQEAGGVMVTFAALCQAAGLDMTQAGDDELARIMRPEIVQKIRAKQAAKPTGSALPIAASQPGMSEANAPIPGAVAWRYRDKNRTDGWRFSATPIYLEDDWGIECQPLYSEPLPGEVGEATRKAIAVVLDAAWGEGLNEVQLDEEKHIDAILAALSGKEQG